MIYIRLMLNSTSQPEIIEEYNGTQMVSEYLCVPWKWTHSWDSGRLRTGPFGDDQISRAQKDYCKTVKDIQETEVQFSLVAQSCPTLCNPMDCSATVFPVHHQPLELAQTHVH